MKQYYWYKWTTAHQISFFSFSFQHYYPNMINQLSSAGCKGNSNMILPDCPTALTRGGWGFTKAHKAEPCCLYAPLRLAKALKNRLNFTQHNCSIILQHPPPHTCYPSYPILSHPHPSFSASTQPPPPCSVPHPILMPSSSIPVSSTPSGYSPRLFPWHLTVDAPRAVWALFEYRLVLWTEVIGRRWFTVVYTGPASNKISGSRE